MNKGRKEEGNAERNNSQKSTLKKHLEVAEMSTMFISNQPSTRIAILCSYCIVDMSIFSNRLGAPQSQELVPGLVWSLA